ncbi:hypothetical protein Y1Q_0005266 [Alligator mississippiensis]|uniref:SCAN box domain-containing protein n=1 Tax=Alligator mississippiensis TaxID=8496 RepID=A0A151MT88_ALLMI|nr:hypothetical protein Y1Q_0005266 [Alligator mississippiensis]
MSREEARNYDKVKKEILYRLDIHPETYHQAFRAWKPREAREPHALWQCLADLVTKWLKPGESSKGEICDKILLDDLDEETQRCHEDKDAEEHGMARVDPITWELQEIRTNLAELLFPVLPDSCFHSK